VAAILLLGGLAFILIRRRAKNDGSADKVSSSVQSSPKGGKSVGSLSEDADDVRN